MFLLKLQCAHNNLIWAGSLVFNLSNFKRISIITYALDSIKNNSHNSYQLTTFHPFYTFFLMHHSCCSADILDNIYSKCFYKFFMPYIRTLHYTSMDIQRLHPYTSDNYIGWSLSWVRSVKRCTVHHVSMSLETNCLFWTNKQTGVLWPVIISTT